MMSAYIPMMTAAALATAGRIGLFEALSQAPLSGSGLAGALGMSVDGVGRLTDFLVAAGHLERRAGLIANTAETTRWFTSRGTIDYASGLAWTADAWRIMDDLSGAVARGRPDRLLWDRMSVQPELGARFARYMHAFAEHLSPDILAAANLPQRPCRLLDLGGSHGRHSIAFCRANPELHAVIVDLDSALTDTRALIAAEGLEDRITVRAGDIRNSDWGGDFDAALYLSVAHNMSWAENRRIFGHLGQVIRPGGLLMIHDYPRETTPALFETAFRLTLLVQTGTQTYTCAEFSEFLCDAGFAEHRFETLSPAEKGTLIVALR
jgi:SAM-dependent methyltransferase